MKACQACGAPGNIAFEDGLVCSSCYPDARTCEMCGDVHTRSSPYCSETCRDTMRSRTVERWPR